MKKYILFFFIFITSKLFTQSWDFMYKDDFLPIAPFSGKHENLYANCLTIYKDNIAISRSYNDLIIIYNQTNKKWTFISKEDIVNMIAGEHNYTTDDFNDIFFINYDNNGRLWATTNEGRIISIYQDSVKIYTSVFNTIDNNFHDIESCFDLKVDRNGDLWAIVRHSSVKLSKVYYSLCKLKNDVFVTINNLTNPDHTNGVFKKIAFDHQGNVWHVNLDTLYVIENEKVKYKLSIWDLPNGYTKFSKIVINSKNVVYALSDDLVLYKIDGDKYSSDDYMRNIERYEKIGQNLLLYDMCVDSSDNIWVSGYSPNLYKLDSSGNWAKYIFPKPDIENFDYFKKNMEADKNGKIWIISDKQGALSWGIYIFNPNGTNRVEEQQENIFSNSILNIYPNPATNEVNLSFSFEDFQTEQIKISLFNTLGMKIKELSYQCTDGRIKFSVEELQCGVYIVNVSNGSKSFKNKLVINGR
ncbi:MAG TPA: T9SS type A sorting domain-containing protein [Candidatus Kapabacteria bacterium]|nr:T9SS type A sorting domain-containing protein [Candidatus Kapabacteria bacterium]